MTRVLRTSSDARLGAFALTGARNAVTVRQRPGEASGQAGASGSPSISIVIPAFNSAPFLADTLQSVLGQSVADWECVIVDDGSTDKTADIALHYAAQYPRFRVARVINGGPSAARNHGYALTNPLSEYVTFMDSDDVWLPHALETLRWHLHRNSAAVGAHGLAEMIDEAGDIIAPGSYPAAGRHRLGVVGRRLVEWPLDRPTTFDVLINGNVLFPPGLLLARRSAYERAGSFDERFRAAEDWDMLIRLSRHGYFTFVDDVILHYRQHESNLGARWTVPRQAWLVRCKGFHSPDNDEPHQLIARRGWYAYQQYMISERWRTARESLRASRPRHAVGELARIPVHLARLIRGYPAPRLVIPSEPWPKRRFQQEHEMRHA